ncbi:hypothetical protein ACIBK8_25710 [Streptomyces sp. NPDC050161]
MIPRTDDALELPAPRTGDGHAGFVRERCLTTAAREMRQLPNAPSARRR